VAELKANQSFSKFCGRLGAGIVRSETSQELLTSGRSRAMMKYALLSLVLISSVSALFWSYIISAFSGWLGLSLHPGVVIAIGIGIFAFVFAVTAGLMVDDD
jgi:hypothetical protein